MRRLAREKVRPESSSCSAPLNTRYGTSSEDGSAVGSGRHRGRQSAGAVGPGRVRRGAQESGAVASALVQYRLPEGGVRGGIPAAGSVLPLWGIPEHLRRLGHQTWTSSSCPRRGPPRQRPAAGGTGGGVSPTAALSSWGRNGADSPSRSGFCPPWRAFPPLPRSCAAPWSLLFPCSTARTRHRTRNRTRKRSGPDPR